MSGGWLRGRLGDPSEAPATGERIDRLIAAGHVVVEQIRSGALEAPADYEQEQDEWVVLLAGRARLVIDGEPVELTSGEWLFLPAGLPHRLVETEPGTNWLAVYLGR